MKIYVSSLEDFNNLSDNNKVEFLMNSCVKEYNLLYHYKNKFCKSFNGQVKMTEEDLISMMYFSMTKTINAHKAKKFYIKENGKIKAITCRNELERKKTMKQYRNKKIKCLREEFVLKVSRPNSEEFKKKAKEFYKAKGYKMENFDKKYILLYPFNTQHRISIKKRLTNYGFQVNFLSSNFKNLHHVLNSFRATWKNNIIKHTTSEFTEKRSGNKDSKNGGVIGHNYYVSTESLKTNADGETRSVLEDKSIKNKLNQEEVREQALIHNELVQKSNSFLAKIELLNKKWPIVDLFEKLYLNDEKVVLKYLKKEYPSLKQIEFNQLRNDIVNLLKIEWLHEEAPELLIKQLGVTELKRLFVKYLNHSEFNYYKEEIEYRLNKEIFLVNETTSIDI